MTECINLTMKKWIVCWFFVISMSGCDAVGWTTGRLFDLQKLLFRYFQKACFGHSE